MPWVDCAICGRTADRACHRCGVPLCRHDVVGDTDHCESCDGHATQIAASVEADARRGGGMAEPLAAAVLAVAAVTADTSLKLWRAVRARLPASRRPPRR